MEPIPELNKEFREDSDSGFRHCCRAGPGDWRLPAGMQGIPLIVIQQAKSIPNEKFVSRR